MSIMYLSGSARSAQASDSSNPQATRTQKTLLLDSCVEWKGYHRKYAIALLNHGKQDQQTIQRRRLPGLFPGNSAERAVF